MIHKEKCIIVGSRGAVGRSVQNALWKTYNVLRHDIEKAEYTVEPAFAQNMIMHVCIPYSDKFEMIVSDYNQHYKSKFIIIHSTVKPGTTKALSEKGINVVHSPIIFKDTDYKSSHFFKKMIGFDDALTATKADIHLKPCYNTALVAGSENTEFSDLCIGLYGMASRAITFEIGKMFENSGLNYSSMKELLSYYNMGFAAMNIPDKMLYNSWPDMNQDDYRTKLIELVPEDVRSSFFTLAQKSFDIQRKKWIKRINKFPINSVSHEEVLDGHKG